MGRSGCPWPYGRSRLDTVKQEPRPAAGREVTNGAAMPAPKVAPLPAQIFIHFKTLAMACANFTITTLIGLTGAFCPVPGQKTNSPPNLFRFSGFSLTCHCHGYAFSCKCWLNFLIWWIDQWQVFGWYWSNFEHCSLQPKFKPFWTPSQRGRWATHHLLGFYWKKTVQFQGKLFTSNFLQAAVAGPILGIDFLR